MARVEPLLTSVPSSHHPSLPMDSVKSLLGKEEEGGISKSVDFAQSCPSLSFKQVRLIFGLFRLSLPELIVFSVCV